MVAASTIEERDVPLAAVEVLVDLQLRAKTCESTVADYAQDMRDGDEFPAVRLFSEGENGAARFFIGDGNHRVLAARACGRETIRARVSPGGRAAALEFAFTANMKNGLRLTPADRIRRIEVALATHPDWSTNRLAEFLRVRQSAVATVRAAGGKVSTGRIGKDGRTRRPIRRAELRPERPPPKVPMLPVTPAVGGEISTPRPVAWPAVCGGTHVVPANGEAIVPRPAPPGGIAIDAGFLRKFRTVAPGRDQAELEHARQVEAKRTHEQADLAIEALRRIPGNSHARGAELERVRAWIEEEQRKATAGEPPETAEALGRVQLDLQYAEQRDAERDADQAEPRMRDESGKFL